MRLRALARPLARRLHDLRIARGREPLSLETVDVSKAPSPSGDGAFDGERAFRLLAEQVEMGPRAPGTDGHRRTLDWLAERLADVADDVVLQSWKQRIDRGPGAGRSFAMTNLLAVVRGTGDDPDRPPEPDLMLSAHWDTRPVADRDPDPALRSEPVPGANDGASGVAVVLEAARALRAERPARTVAFALWDGEDLGEYYYGSRAYAHAARRGRLPWRPRRGVLLDMVGKRGLRCDTETNSLRLAPELWAELHACAADLGLAGRFGGARRTISDDHLFLSRAGIPTVLLIDYAYPEWHTTRDTEDRCDADALRTVGQTVVHLVRSTRA